MRCFSSLFCARAQNFAPNPGHQEHCTCSHAKRLVVNRGQWWILLPNGIRVCAFQTNHENVQFNIMKRVKHGRVRGTGLTVTFDHRVNPVRRHLDRLVLVFIRELWSQKSRGFHLHRWKKWTYGIHEHVFYRVIPLIDSIVSAASSSLFVIAYVRHDF